ncbi:unnamed protein product [Caenorhabditis nigoni]
MPNADSQSPLSRGPISSYTAHLERRSTKPHSPSSCSNCYESIVSILSFGFYRRTNFMGLDANGPVY